MNAWSDPRLAAAHVLLALTVPILLVGVVNRTKAWWGGRKGPPLLQLGWDLLRLLRKRPVVSQVATPLFRAAAWIVLAACALSALIAPLFGAFAPLSFQQDFVLMAYALGLSRLFLMVAALDVGSAFEGMGAAREASFTTFIEPAFFMLMGTAALATSNTSLAGALGRWQSEPSFGWLVAPAVLVLFVMLQAEASRVPVDDPATHLELTMIHEVMVLDHSGPELAAMQLAAALKMTLYAGLIATLLNPFAVNEQPGLAVVAGVLLILLVGVVVGCIESLTARLQMRHVPRYLLLASAVASACLVSAGWLGMP